MNVVCCRIDEYNAKEVKESIFLVNARENQTALISLAQCNQACSQQPAQGSIGADQVL